MHASDDSAAQRDHHGVVVVLAGRRIDAIATEARRFPIENISRVGEALRACFSELGATALVCSAANGADLIALRIANERSMRIHVVLGCAVEEFRRVSVTDRPGAEWGALFDHVIAAADARADLVVLDTGVDCDAYDTLAAVNARLVGDAQQIATAMHSRVVGVAVWEGHSRGAEDVTAGFVELLRVQSISVRHVATLGDGRPAHAD
jgi:hypothetical protein